MITQIKLLTAAGLLAGEFIAGAAMQANPLGGSMTGHESGEKISSSSMMGKGSGGSMMGRVPVAR